MATSSCASQTSYLPAARATADELARAVAAAAGSPVVQALLHASGTALAVLDEHRQVVAVNASWLELAGLEAPADALGLRAGEALRCDHAWDGPEGCGTGPACPTCGAAIVQLVAGHHGRAAERDCHLAAAGPAGEAFERELRARAAPLDLAGMPFVLLTLTDVTAARRRERVDRAFLHDLRNLAAGLMGAAVHLDASPAEESVADVQLLADELVGALRVQTLLLEEQPELVRANLHPVDVRRSAEALARAVRYHPAAARRTLETSVAVAAQSTVRSDAILLRHVVVNLLVNALEATRAGGTVRLSVTEDSDAVAFRVWNEGAIPAAVVPRIFQRYFTTKTGAGRGQGTFATRLFGESYLGGEVTFTTSATGGTTFQLRLPRHATR